MSSEAIHRQPDVLDSFSKVQIDPIFAAVFEKISVYNDLLQTQAVTEEQVVDIMNELDAEWNSLLSEKMLITGVVSFLPDDMEGSYGEPVRDFYEEHEMEFGGVLPIKVGDAPAIADGDTLTEEPANYMLGLRLTREGITPEGGLLTMHGTARIDEILSITVPNMMSAPGAREWLDYHHPEYIQDIDVALLNPSKEECEMVMRLRDVAVDVKLPHDDDTSRQLRSMQALNIYTNSLFNFDKDVPYLLSVSGDGWQPTEDGMVLPAYLSGTTMASLDRVIWLAAEREEDHIVYPHLAARFLAETKDDPAVEMYVPLQSVTVLKSYRYDYFVGYEE